MNVPPGRPDLQGPTFKAYAVAAGIPGSPSMIIPSSREPTLAEACYCPDFQRCDSFSPDYVQQVGNLGLCVGAVRGLHAQVGLLYFFATKALRCSSTFRPVLLTNSREGVPQRLRSRGMRTGLHRCRVHGLKRPDFGTSLHLRCCATAPICFILSSGQPRKALRIERRRPQSTRFCPRF